MGFLSDFIQKVKTEASHLAEKTKDGVVTGYNFAKDKVGDVQNYFNKDKNKAQLLEVIKQVCADGTITAEEVKEINTLRETLGLNDADIEAIHGEILKIVMERVKADGKVTEEDEKFIEDVTTNLHLKPESIAEFKQELEKFRNETK